MATAHKNSRLLGQEAAFKISDLKIPQNQRPAKKSLVGNDFRISLIF